MGAVTVGLDIGTTSIKAVAVDGAGRVLQRARVPHKVVVRGPNMMEHDAGVVWRRGTRRALAALGAVGPAAVAVTSMVPSLTAVDAKGRPLTPGLLYGDSRGAQEPARPSDPAPEGGSAQTEMEGFLRWTAAAAPHAHGYWPAQAVANFGLGGCPAVDQVVGFIAAPVLSGDGWNREILARCGAEADQLPAVEAPGSAVGRLDGADDGPLLTAGSVDVWCEQMVAGAAEEGDVHVICGTTLIIWATRSSGGATAAHPGVWTVPHAKSGLEMIGGASNAGGLFLDWANRLIGRTQPGPVDPANVPVWAPYPRGERTPYHDPARRAGLIGLDLTHGPDAIRRAAWEASAFVVRHHLELGGVPARRIVATGGGTKVGGWMQALADGTGLPVHVAADPEGAARGAAFLARIAAGLERDVTEAARWASTGSVVDPRPEWVEPAGDRYRRFLEMSGPPGPTVP